MESPDWRRFATVSVAGGMGREVARRNPAIRRDFLRHHRHAHVSRFHRMHLSPDSRAWRQQAEARRCRNQRTLLALRRFGLDVRFPNDLLAVDLSKERINDWRRS